MSHSPFKKGNKVETIDAMIDYVLFVQNIAQQEQIPGALLTLAQTIDELKLEKQGRVDAQNTELKQSA